MRDEHIEFLERIWIDQELDTLARSQFSFFVLRFNPGLAAAQFGLGPHFIKLPELFFQRHRETLLYLVFGQTGLDRFCYIFPINLLYSRQRGVNVVIERHYHVLIDYPG